MALRWYVVDIMTLVLLNYLNAFQRHLEDALVFTAMIEVNLDVGLISN